MSAEYKEDLAPPSHWQAFEDLCLKLWRPRLVDAKKNGRSGQSQAGVDIFGRDPKTEAWVGIQCKQRGQWPKKVLTVGEIEAEVEQAEAFEPSLSHFIIATTAPRDVEAQRFVRELSDRRQAKGKFSVDLFAWDDLQDWLQEGPEPISREKALWTSRSVTIEGNATGNVIVTGDYAQVTLVADRSATLKAQKDFSAYSGLRAVPSRPPHYLPRPEFLGPIKRALLQIERPRIGVVMQDIIGVHGMGGVGKSVAAAAIADDPDVYDAFPDGTFWVTVGREPDLTKLQLELAAEVGEPRATFSSPHEGHRVLKDIFTSLRVLLVLDDLWSIDDASSLRIVGEQGRILLTTRDAEILVGLGAKGNELDILEPRQSLVLLSSWSNQPVEDLPELAMQVAEACGHLPLALAMIGSMARRRHTAWRDALYRLEHADLDKLRRRFPDYPYPTLLRALEVSVTHLDSMARDRYKDLAVFPEDAAVPITAVEILWSESNLDEYDSRDLIELMIDRSLAFREGDAIYLHNLQIAYLRRVTQDLSALHERLIRAYALRCGGNWPKLTDDGYAFQHIARHLAAAGHRHDLRRLLLSHAWLEAKIYVTGINALITDYDLLSSQRDLKLIQDALRLSAHIILDNPRQLAWQLVCRLEGFRVDTLSEFLKESRLAARAGPWLRPFNTCLMTPGGSIVRSFTAGKSYIYCIAVIDERRLISGSDNDIRVWDLETGDVLLQIKAEMKSVKSVAVLGEDKAVSGSSDGSVRVWSIESGEELYRFEVPDTFVQSVAVLGDRFLASGTTDGIIRIWDIEKKVQVRSIESKSGGILRILSIAVLGDDRVVAGLEDGVVRVWKLDTGQEIQSLVGHTDMVTSVTVVDQNRVVSGSQDESLRVWDVQTGEELVRFEGHTGGIRAIGVLDERLIVSGSRNSELCVWDVTTGKEFRRLECPGGIRSLAVLRSGQVAVGAGSLRVWGLSAGTDEPYRGRSIGVSAVAILGDSRAVSGSSDGSIRIWDLNAGEVLQCFETGESIVSLALLERDRVVTGGTGGWIRVWDLKTGARLFEGQQELNHFPYSLQIRCLAGIHENYVLCGADSGIVLYNITTGEPLQYFGRRMGVVLCVEVLDDGSMLSGAQDGSIRLWDPFGGREIQRLIGHEKGISSLAVLNRYRIVSGCEDGSMRVWDMRSGRTIRHMPGHAEWVTGLAVLAEDKVLSVSWSHNVKLWDVNTGELCASFTMDESIGVLAVDCQSQILIMGISGRMHLFQMEWADDSLRSRPGPFGSVTSKRLGITWAKRLFKRFRT